MMVAHQRALVSLGVLSLVNLFLVQQANAQARAPLDARWQLVSVYNKHADTVYLDTATIAQVGPTTRGAWFRNDYTMLQRMSGGSQIRYDHILSNLEVNCRERTFHLLITTFYRGGAVVGEASGPSPAAVVPPPESLWEYVVDAVCAATVMRQ